MTTDVVTAQARASAAPTPTARRGTLRGLVRGARPHQWLKNVLVLAAPAAAGVLTRPGPLARSLAAAALFCLVAGGLYLLNDVADVEADRLHPEKRFRPVAAGEVPVRLALIAGALSVAAGIGLADAVAGWRLLLVVGSYAGVTIAYSWFLKHEPVLDLAAVASGFVLRAIAGGVAAHVPLSDWFLIVASFGSLFMVTGKREAEKRRSADVSHQQRRSLAHYSPEYLRSLRTMASAVTILAYCLWAFQRAGALPASEYWLEATIVPFTLALVRYSLLIDRGHGEAPEDVVLGDRRLQILGFVWATLFAVGVYVV